MYVTLETYQELFVITIRNQMYIGINIQVFAELVAVMMTTSTSTTMSMRHFDAVEMSRDTYLDHIHLDNTRLLFLQVSYEKTKTHNIREKILFFVHTRKIT